MATLRLRPWPVSSGPDRGHGGGDVACTGIAPHGSTSPARTAIGATSPTPRAASRRPAGAKQIGDARARQPDRGAEAAEARADDRHIEATLVAGFLRPGFRPWWRRRRLHAYGPPRVDVTEPHRHRGAVADAQCG